MASQGYQSQDHHRGDQSQDHSPRDSHSNSPPSLPHPHQLQLQPPQLHIPSPQKTETQFTPMTTMSVPGFPPSMSSSLFSQAPPQADPFSALGQLGQDLRLSTPHHITQWLQQAQPQPPSPVKNEPLSPRSQAE